MKKIDLLLHMTEHPELYTDRQLQEMLRDDEYRALYDTMVKTKRAYIRHKMQHATVSTEQEWRRFERMYKTPEDGGCRRHRVLSVGIGSSCHRITYRQKRPPVYHNGTAGAARNAPNRHEQHV